MANTPIYNMTDTWNAGGTTFNAIKMSVTDTASAAGSKLLDLLVGGSSKFSVDKAGNVAAAGTLASTGNFSVNTDKFTVAASTGNTVVAGTLNGLQVVQWNPSTSNMHSLAIRTGGTNDLTPYSRQSIFIGHRTGINITAGDGLTASGLILIGNRAGEAITTGGSNVAIGASALAAQTTGCCNVAIGTTAGAALNGGANNVFVGFSAANLQTAGDNNISIGRQSQLDSLTDSFQINIGARYFHDRIQLKNAAVGAGDCILIREAANILAMRNGINAQTFRLYNTYTDASTYDRAYMRWDSNTLLIGHDQSPNTTARAIEFQTNGVSRMRLGLNTQGNAAQLLINTTSLRQSTITTYVPGLVYESTSQSSGSWLFAQNSATNSGFTAFFVKSRGTTANSVTAAQEDDGIAGFAFRACDGVDAENTAASFGARVDGPVSENNTPGRLAFSTTPAGSGTALERLRINSAGNVGIGTTVPGRRLDVNDASGNCLRLTYNDADGSATNFCDLLVSSGGDLTIDPSGGDVTIDGTVQTAAPTGGTAAKWKLGTVASVSPTSPNRTIEVEIGGTTYYLAAKTTND